MGKIHRELFFLEKKVDFSETSTEILRKFVFLTIVEGANPEENLDLFKQLFFYQTSKSGQILTQTVFLHKMSHILLNYTFPLFLSILGEIYRELSSLDIKVTISETSNEILKFFFLPCLKGTNPEENLNLFKQLFFSNQ